MTGVVLPRRFAGLPLETGGAHRATSWCRAGRAYSALRDSEGAVTEVPEHLLRRSRERRQAMGGEGSQSEAGAPATEAASTDVAPSAAAAPAPAGATAAPAARAPAEPAYTGPPPAPPRKQRVPAWAMPVLAALPFWAILYGGAFGERATDDSGPLARGAVVYGGECANCHGPTGGGGIGPAMGAVEQTFPSFDDHVQWVRTGSAPVRGQPYGATGKISTGGMPSFPDLSDADVIAVVCHERVTLGEESPPPAQCAEGADPDAGGADAAAEH